MVKLGVLDIEGTKYALKLGETYLIGNKTEEYIHDIEIDDASVDIKHCILDFTEKLPRLFDIRSKCGTFVDGIRVARCQIIPIVKSTTIQFGDVESTLQLLGEGDSGYLEGQLSPPAKNNSQIIHNSPESVASSGSRLRQTLKNSLTSTPNATTTTNKSIQITNYPQIKPSAAEFLIPSKLPRRSTGSNTSTRSVDSFYIPETQYPVESNNSPNVSIHSDKSNDKSTNTTNDDDDFFIPETQEVVGSCTKLSNYPRVAFRNENINETIADDDKIPSSQFRICTQDFNGSDDDLSNNSDDILANVPCSLVIPAIHHEPVRIDDFVNPNNDEEDVEKEMSALQWSKRTGDDAERSVTPDGLVTPDIIEDETKDAASQCGSFEEPVNERIDKSVNTMNRPSSASKMIDKSINTIYANREVVIDQDVLPTQLFVKLPSHNKAVVKLLPLPCDKENIGPEKEDSLFLPPTQQFMPPPTKVSPVALPPPPPPPPLLPPPESSIHDDNDLPPTQVFKVACPAVTSSKYHCFSSTLVDTETLLSDNSFKAKCNKLLDSDDDEMDEVIAPELVKKMRESLEKSEESTKSLTETTIQAAEATNPSQYKVDVPVSKENPIATPTEKFITPATVAKKTSRAQPAVSIDKFLFTPDFLGKEFSKDENLQKLAEVNWNNLISEKQRKSLFGNEDSDGNPVNDESDDSQDSFNDLLPHKEKKDQNRIKSKPEKPIENMDSKSSTETEEGRITRRRKSAFPEETKETKVPKMEILKDEPDKKAKRESKSKKTIEPTKEESNESQDNKKNVKKSHKESRRINPGDKTEREKATMKNEEKTQDRHTSRRSERPSKNTKPETARTTRQSSYDLKTNLEKMIKVKHCTESDNSSHNQSNSSDGKAGEHRNGFKHKESEKKNGSIDKSGLKTARTYRNDPEKSSSKPTKSSDADNLAEKVSKRRKNETARSKELTKVKEKEEKPLPRVTRLRSGKDTSVSKKKGDMTELTITKIVPNLENNKLKACKDGDDKSKKKSTKRKDTTTQEQNFSVIHLTETDGEDTSDKAPEPIKKTHSANNDVNPSVSAENGKRKVEKSESRSKRLRSEGSLDSDQFDLKHLPKSQKPKVKIAITMCDPRYQDILEKHSGGLWIYTKDPKECDVLVVEKGNRTYKLMVAIARGTPIVKLDWLIEVLKKRSIDIPFEQYIFEDPLFQERHQFHMKKSLNMAKTTSLFDGISFMMTPGIRPAPEEMKDIIICAGGTVLEHIPKTQPKQRLFLVSQPKDNQHWHRFRRTNSNIKIVTSEGVMASVMQQSENPLIMSTIQ